MPQTVKPKHLGRCTRCRRLVAKASLKPFNGGRYGPECISLAINAARDDEMRDGGQDPWQVGAK